MASLDRFMRSGLRLRHLRLIVALDDLRNVSRVAAYLNVSQPAVSKTLSSLEAGLDVSLFQRTARGLEPTEHGECLIRHARDILGRLSGAREEMRDISEGRVTHIALGALPSATVSLIPRFIVRLEEAAADVTVSVREGTMATLLPDVRSGELDMAVGFLPEGLGPEFSSELLYEDRIVAVVRHAHPLTARRKLNWSMITGYPMVLPTQNSLTRGAIDAMLLQHGVDLARRHVESVSTSTNAGVLQFSDSIGFFAAETARSYSAMGVLSVLPLDGSNLTMRVGLVWMTSRRMTTAHKLVHRIFKETRDDMQPAMEEFASRR